MDNIKRKFSLETVNFFNNNNDNQKFRYRNLNYKLFFFFSLIYAIFYEIFRTLYFFFWLVRFFIALIYDYSFWSLQFYTKWKIIIEFTNVIIINVIIFIQNLNYGLLWETWLFVFFFSTVLLSKFIGAIFLTLILQYNLNDLNLELLTKHVLLKIYILFFANKEKQISFFLRLNLLQSRFNFFFFFKYNISIFTRRFHSFFSFWEKNF